MDDNTQTDPQNVEGTWGNLANGKYPISELFRRTGERLKATWKNTMNDPIGTPCVQRFRRHINTLPFI